MKDISGLNHPIYSESEKNQSKLIPQLLKEGEAGLETLMDWMISLGKESDNLALGQAYQTLYLDKNRRTQEFLASNFPHGVVSLKSEHNVDYRPLQELLAQQDFQRADIVTLQKLCELAGSAAIERKWIYFTEVESFPIEDLLTLDKLWLMHSEGKFGFSVQRRIWLSVGKDFSKLWTKIGWKAGNSWTRYPKEFTWDLTAPKGHLPLSNQLRGVRVIDAIFAHPAWSQTN
ncbi:GUN4 domain-containing protein [Pleurocapsa sp. PCC 7319]|uniref:GUN4 domain-containing protein n=1 Tax=Pleurocapsa sp. PCC 7319 TaxID=118161 RepID=UPI000346F12B|nr:GUN4 domain-containing protein [Pleurocapsa sp. PCC 7319]